MAIEVPCKRPDADSQGIRASLRSLACAMLASLETRALGPSHPGLSTEIFAITSPRPSVAVFSLLRVLTRPWTNLPRIVRLSSLTPANFSRGGRRPLAGGFFSETTRQQIGGRRFPRRGGGTSPARTMSEEDRALSAA